MRKNNLPAASPSLSPSFVVGPGLGSNSAPPLAQETSSVQNNALPVHTACYVLSCNDSWQEALPALQLVVVEEVVANYHANLLDAELPPSLSRVVKTGGKDAKTWKGVEELLIAFTKHRLCRNLAIGVIGGGAFLDLVAFAASIYQRGMPVVLVPSTWLAAVDAGLGGKNGIDFGGYKNYVGTIVQPERLLIDFRLLGSLPKQGWADGFAEVVKYACLADPALFKDLARHDLPTYCASPLALRKLCLRCLKHKAHFVVADPEDRKNKRVMLNFGHTYGHVLEQQLGCSHGQAVAVGMLFSCYASVQEKVLSFSVYEQLRHVLGRYGLLEVFIKSFEESVWMDLLQGDKKQTKEGLTEVLLADIGKPLLKTFSHKAWLSLAESFQQQQD